MAAVIKNRAPILNNPVDDLLNNECDLEHKVVQKRSPVITISIYNFKFPALIDTGSEVTCLSGDVYSQLSQFHDKIPCFPVSGVRVTGAFRTKERRVTHQMFLKFTINNANFEHEFLLISDLIFPVILGSDFLRVAKAQVHLDKNQLVLYCNDQVITVSEINTNHEFNPPPDLSVLKLCAVKQNAYSFINSLDLNSTLDLSFLENISSINYSEKNVLKTLLLKYNNLFSDQPGRTSLYTHEITLNDYTPFKMKQYPIPFAHREAVFKEIKKMEDWGVIERAATPYINPLVTAVKRDGTVRVCLDARRLNSCMVRDHELPRPIDEILKSLSGARFKSCLDLSSSYFQIPLREGDKKYTGFLLGTQTYQFTCLPFGLCTAVSSFTRCISKILGPEFDSFVIAYIDDLLIFSESFEDHIGHLARVFSRLSEAGFTVKFKKCNFVPDTLKYLGYVITCEGICPDPERVDTIKGFPAPRNIKGLQSFLGLCNYDRNFCENFSSAVEPLTRLLRKKTKWAWNEEQQHAFERIKKILSNEIFLYHPDQSLDFFVQTDASEYGLGAQLYQRATDGRRCVIAYASRLLLDREKAYTSFEKEVLAAVFALKKWRTYLLGRRFHILTDCRAMIYIHTCRLLTPRVTRWALALQEYDFAVHFIKGKENIIADVLSRYPNFRLATPSDRCFKLFNFQIKLPPDLNKKIKSLPEAQSADAILGPIIASLKSDPNSVYHNKYTLHKDLLFMRISEDSPYLACLPNNLVNTFVQAYHETLGHFGVYKTWTALKHDFFWPNMFRNIKRIIKHCDICQRAKVAPLEKPPLLTVPSSRVNELISLDLYGPLVKSRGGVTFLCVIIDVFSKFITLYPLKKATSRAILNRLQSDYFKRHGPVEKILTDHGSQFTAKSWEATLSSLGVKPTYSSVRHPQSNPVERYMRELSRLFRTFCSEHHTLWANEVPKLADFLNSVVHESTGFSPRELQLKEGPLSLLRDRVEYPPSGTPLPYEAKLILAQESMQGRLARRSVTNPKPSSCNFTVGDLVLLRSNPVSSTIRSEMKKFLLLFEGPYKIKKKIAPATFILVSPDSDKERGMFHASHFKTYYPPMGLN